MSMLLLCILMPLLTSYSTSTSSSSRGIGFHLGCDFIRDDEGTMFMTPKQHMEKLLETYEQIFGSKLKQNVTSPLEKSDHPELDNEGIKNYQSLIGALQWSGSLGCLDITTAMTTLSCFRVVVTYQGHMERASAVHYCLLVQDETCCHQIDFIALPD